MSYPLDGIARIHPKFGAFVPMLKLLAKSDCIAICLALSLRFGAEYIIDF